MESLVRLGKTLSPGFLFPVRKSLVHLGKTLSSCFLSQIMESLVRLGKTYVQLCSDGCVLFLDWSVEFLCDVERPVCCVSEFARQGKLKGHRTKPGHAGKAQDLEVKVVGTPFPPSLSEDAAVLTFVMAVCSVPPPPPRMQSGRLSVLSAVPLLSARRPGICRRDLISTPLLPPPTPSIHNLVSETGSSHVRLAVCKRALLNNAVFMIYGGWKFINFTNKHDTSHTFRRFH